MSTLDDAIAAAVKSDTFPQFARRRDLLTLDDRVEVLEPLPGIRRNLINVSGSFPASPAGTRGLCHNGTFLNGSNGANALVVLLLNAAQYALAGKTPKLKIRASAQVNGTAPGAGLTFTIGLHELTATAGAAGGITPTIAAAVAGSTFQVNGGANLAAGQRYSDETTPAFNIPATIGDYLVGVVTNNAMAAGSFVSISAVLQLYYE
jgi:hypothetical protein